MANWEGYTFNRNYLWKPLVLKVDPYNGAPESYIIKTFYADSYTWSKQYIR